MQQNEYDFRVHRYDESFAHVDFHECTCKHIWKVMSLRKRKIFHDFSKFNIVRIVFVRSYSFQFRTFSAQQRFSRVILETHFAWFFLFCKSHEFQLHASSLTNANEINICIWKNETRLNQLFWMIEYVAWHRFKIYSIYFRKFQHDVFDDEFDDVCQVLNIAFVHQFHVVHFSHESDIKNNT